jgi:hypothetical protein
MVSDLTEVRESLIRRGVDLASNRPAMLEDWSCDESSPACEYLATCLPAAPLTASGVGVKTPAQVDEENQPWVSPGGVLARFGFVVIATSIGGNAIVLDLHGSGMYWADRSRFVDAERLEYIDPSTGQWTNPVPYSRDGVQSALDLIDPDAVAGLHLLFDDRLTEQLESRDHG